MYIVEVTSTTPKVDLMNSSSQKRSKLMMQLMEQQPHLSTIADEKSAKVKLEDCTEPCIDWLRDDSL